MIKIQSLASSSAGNAYHITDGRFPLLLECGIPWKRIQQGLNYETSSIGACLVSHSHNDHAGHIKEVLKAGINCYMSRETAQAKDVEGHHRVKIIEPEKQFMVSTWDILPFPTQHDCEGSLGFLMANQAGDKLLFLTDSFYCRYTFKGLSHIMLEINYAIDILRENVRNGTVPVPMKNRILQSHFSLENAKKFLQANDLSRVQEIHLIHLSDDNSDADRFKREIQALTGKMVIVADS